jgi:uncharacterized protein YdaU (DUF1376 family)
MAKTDKAPAFQWYPKDWQSDEAVKGMTYEQRGIYRELLDHQWFHRSIPADAKLLADMLKIPFGRFKKIWPKIAIKFKPKGRGRLANRRLERVRAAQVEYARKQSENGKKGAAAKHQRDAGGASGGATKSPLAISSSSSSSASSSLKTPPVPPALRGDAQVSTRPPTRKEQESAIAALREWRRSVDFEKQCPHEPACPDETACVGRVVQETRLAVAEGQELALAGRKAS